MPGPPHPGNRGPLPAGPGSELGARLPRPHPSCSATAGCRGLERGERRAVPWAPRARPTRLQGPGGQTRCAPRPPAPPSRAAGLQSQPQGGPPRRTRSPGQALAASRGQFKGRSGGPRWRHRHCPRAGGRARCGQCGGLPGRPGRCVLGPWTAGRLARPLPRAPRSSPDPRAGAGQRGPGWVEGVSGSTGPNKGAPGTWRAPWGPQHLPLTVGSAPGPAGTTEPGGPPAPGSSAPWVPPPRS